MGNNGNKLIVIKNGAREAFYLTELAKIHDDGDLAQSVTAADLESAAGQVLLAKMKLDDACGDAYVDGSVISKAEFLTQALTRVQAMPLYWQDCDEYTRPHFHWYTNAENADHDALKDNCGARVLPLVVEINSHGELVDLNYLSSQQTNEGRSRFEAHVSKGRLPPKTKILAKNYLKGRDDILAKMPWQSTEGVSYRPTSRFYDFDGEGFYNFYNQDPKSAAIIFSGIDQLPNGGDFYKYLNMLTRLGYSPKEMAGWVTKYQNGGLAALFVLGYLSIQSPHARWRAARECEAIAREIGALGKTSKLSPIEVATQVANLFIFATPDDDEKALSILRGAKSTSDYDVTIQWMVLSMGEEKSGAIFAKLALLKQAGFSQQEIYDTLTGLPYYDAGRGKNTFIGYFGSYEQQVDISLACLKDLVVECVVPYKESSKYVSTYLVLATNGHNGRSGVHAQDTWDAYKADFGDACGAIDQLVKSLRAQNVPEPLIEEVFYNVLDVSLLNRANPNPSNHGAWDVSESLFNQAALTAGIDAATIQKMVDDCVMILLGGGSHE